MTMDDRRLRAFEMYVDEHVSMRTIAERFGVDRTTISTWVNHEHERVLAGVAKYAEVVRSQQNSQIDQILERWMPLALSENLQVEGDKTDKKGNRTVIELDSWNSGTKAAEIVLKAMALKARNNGLHTIEIKQQPNNPAAGLREIMEAVVPSFQRLIDRKPIEAEIVSSERTDAPSGTIHV